MKGLGATLVKENRNEVFMEAKNGLESGQLITLKRSVGATETALMAASLVNGMVCVILLS
jgi:UDP-N-acetylglucosamine enolpyruvyl transferase